MPSADLLSTIVRERTWPQRAGKAIASLAIVPAALAAIAYFDPRAGAYARTALDQLGVWPAAAAPIEPMPAAAPAKASVEAVTAANATAPAEPAEAKEPVGDAAQMQVHARKLTDWLADIAASAGRGLILAPEVSGEATAHFAEATSWEERLAALSRIHGFHYTVGERLIEAWVRPRETEAVAATRTVAATAIVAAADDEPRERGARSDERAARDDEEKAEDAATVAEVIHPTHARAADLVSAVAKAARAGKVEVAPDPGSNSVVVAGEESAAHEIAELVRALDVPRRRFVLEAEIVELSSTARRELGVRWSIDGTVGAVVDFPAAESPGESAGIIVATDGAHALRARISTLEADGHVRVVSRPRVVVLEGRPASIESVRILRVRFPSSTVVGQVEDGGAVSSGRAFEEIPVGVTLKVEPSMQGDGRIVLRIRAKSSTLGPPQPPDDIPEELSRMVDAEVAVADGETAILGGLLREGTDRSGAGVPYLRSVPLLGLLFGKRSHRDEGEELVVLVTPRLIQP
jgi:type II secretory pathway component GspD/PulD (secretin)